MPKIHVAGNASPSSVNTFCQPASGCGRPTVPACRTHRPLTHVPTRSKLLFHALKCRLQLEAITAGLYCPSYCLNPRKPQLWGDLALPYRSKAEGAALHSRNQKFVHGAILSPGAPKVMARHIHPKPEGPILLILSSVY